MKIFNKLFLCNFLLRNLYFFACNIIFSFYSYNLIKGGTKSKKMEQLVYRNLLLHFLIAL
jgi:hypothetical protein